MKRFIEAAWKRCGLPAVLSLFLPIVFLVPPASPGERLAPPRAIEEAKARDRFLDDEAAQVDRWVEGNWEAEFSKRYPDISNAPRGSREKEQDYKGRELRLRMAIAELKGKMRAERAYWVGAEKAALLEAEIVEDLPARLGAYDAERGEYALLLGFGWPAGLSVRFRVPERDKAVFEIRFPGKFPGRFRINEKGEILLIGLDKGILKEDAVITVAPSAPRLIWQNAHESWVTAVSFHPDGSRAASSGGDGAISVWDVETGHRLLHLKDVEMALSLAYSPDGATLASGGADSFLRLRDAVTGKEIWQSRASGMIFSVSFSADGRFIATGDDAGNLRFWSAGSGKEVLRAEIGSPVRAVAFSPEGRTVAAGTEGGQIVLWDMASNRQVWRKEIGGPVYATAMSGRDGTVAVGGGGDQILILREADGTDVWQGRSDGEARTVQFDRAGRLLGVGGSGYTARILNPATGAPLWTAFVGSPVRSLAFGPLAMKLVVGSADFNVRMFEVDEGDRTLAAFCSHGRVYIEREKAPNLFRAPVR